MGRSRRHKALRYSPRRNIPVQQPPEPPSQNREDILSAVGYDAIELQQMVERPLTPNDLTINALYVDVVKKRQQEDSDYEEPVKPIEFTMSKKDFPALPGKKKSGKQNSLNGDNDAAVSLDGDSSTDEFVSYDGDNEHDDDFSSQSEKSSSCDGAVGGVLSESDIDLLSNANMCNQYNNSPNLTNMSNINNYNYGAQFNASTPHGCHVPPPPGFEDTLLPNLNTSHNTQTLRDLTIEAEELRIRLQHCLAANYNKRIAESSMSSLPPNVYPTVLGNKYGLLALANTLNERYMTEKLLDSFDETYGTGFSQPLNEPPVFSVDPFLLGIEMDAPPSTKLHESFSGAFGHYTVGPGSVYASVPPSYIMNERIKLHAPKISEMEAELLFYFFYLYPGDMMQMLAASELAHRNWRYHIRERMWLRRQDGFPTYVFIGTRECGMFNYFSYNRWKICEHYFEIDINELEQTTTKQQLYDIYGYHPQMG